MFTPIFGIIASSIGVVWLVLLFNFEAKKGKRTFGAARDSLDRSLLRIENVYISSMQKASSGLSRQAVHFFFHTLLVGLLRLLRRCEEKIDVLLRSNRTLAKKAREVNAAKSKLDEIAEHKASVALSDEERKRRREESLNG